MYRTHSTLLKYCVPVLLVAGVALALWQIVIPWYVLLILVPLVLVSLVLIVGKVALSKETRNTQQSFSNESLWKAAPVNGPGAPGSTDAPSPTSPNEGVEHRATDVEV